MSAQALAWGTPVLLAYAALVWAASPKRVTARQFFGGASSSGAQPSFMLLVASAAITWIFAKSIANAANLAQAFGIAGGVGYAIYYLSFLTAAVAIYLIRTRTGAASLAEFLVSKYGRLAAKVFLIAIAIRLFNEVWSNTKVAALYFGAEGDAGYWGAVVLFTALTVAYSLRGGLRSSLLTDGAQMVLALVLLGIVLAFVGPRLAETGLPDVPLDVHRAGLTFCLLALVQVLSYPFHDPVLTDRAFITQPRRMVLGFIAAGALAGGFILLFSTIGLYARAADLEGPSVVAVPAALGVPMLLAFNAIMLTSAGSTLDSTFASSAKLAVQDWTARLEPDQRQVRLGRWVMAVVAVAGNLPLLSLYLGERVGPAIIAATTISGTMVMGLAPIFLLSFIRRAGALSFHLAFWPGLALGVAATAVAAMPNLDFPAWLAIGSGTYADDLALNVYGLGLCTAGYLFGAIVAPRRNAAPAPAARATIHGD